MHMMAQIWAMSIPPNASEKLEVIVSVVGLKHRLHVCNLKLHTGMKHR